MLFVCISYFSDLLQAFSISTRLSTSTPPDLSNNARIIAVSTSFLTCSSSPPKFASILCIFSVNFYFTGHTKGKARPNFKIFFLGRAVCHRAYRQEEGRHL